MRLQEEALWYHSHPESDRHNYVLLTQHVWILDIIVNISPIWFQLRQSLGSLWSRNFSTGGIFLPPDLSFPGSDYTPRWSSRENYMSLFFPPMGFSFKSNQTLKSLSLTRYRYTVRSCILRHSACEAVHTPLFRHTCLSFSSGIQHSFHDIPDIKPEVKKSTGLWGILNCAC